MNKPILMATVALVTLMGTTFAMPAFQIANAQYTGGGGGLSVGGSIEQQLKLAREKVSNAQQAGAYGSGTSIFGSGINLNSTFGFIIIIAVIFGGVAAMFFIRARTPRKEATA
jgi:hypothetical protein